jgi:lactate dehydrogenase-like 2-hydroxyacid dehydrogenase
MRVVFLDKATLGGGLNLKGFHDFGPVDFWDASAENEIIRRLKEAETAVINKIRITQDILRSLPSLKLICLTATGYDNVDIEACRAAGVAVCNVQGYSTPSVAQHTIAMALSLIEPLDYWDRFVKSGDYSGSGAFTHLGAELQRSQRQNMGYFWPWGPSEGRSH